MNSAPGYGAVRLRKKGKYWHVRYRLPDGSRMSYSLKVTNRSVGERRAREINDQLERGEIQSRVDVKANRGRTFAQLAKTFLEHYAGWTPRTRQGASGAIRYLVERFGQQPVATISTMQITEYLAERVRENGLSAGTYNRYRSILSTMFRFAIDQGWLTRNPCAGVKMTREPRKVPRPYSDGELARLLAQLPEKQRYIAVVAVDTGLRRGELRELLWDHVSFEENTLRVVDTKNKRDRLVPMTPRVGGILSGLRREQSQSQVVSLHVFGPSADILRAIHEAAERVGIRGATQHRLRDTFGTKCFDAGIPAQEVQRLMGHRDIHMTMRYAQVREHRLHDAISRLAAISTP